MPYVPWLSSNEATYERKSLSVILHFAQFSLPKKTRKSPLGSLTYKNQLGILPDKSHCSSPAWCSGGSVSSGHLPCSRDQCLAHPGLGQHGGRQPLPPWLRRELDRLRASSQVGAVRIHPLLLQPPPVRLPGDAHRHRDWPTAHQKQLKNGTEHIYEEDMDIRTCTKRM